MTEPTIEREIVIQGAEKDGAVGHGYDPIRAVSVTIYFWSTGQVSHTKYPEWRPCTHNRIRGMRFPDGLAYCPDCETTINLADEGTG